MSNPPVDFEERARRPKGSAGSDYPYAIKATDLMQNFVFATLDMDTELYEETTGIGGHPQRRLKIPRPPSDGTFVLGVQSGTMRWISTEECT